MIDLHRLGQWMDEQGLPSRGEPIKHRFLSGGTQNEIYEISRGELRCAIRIPPPSAPASARVWTMARPMPRDPPVTTATLPVRSCSAAKEVTSRSCHGPG